MQRWTAGVKSEKQMNYGILEFCMLEVEVHFSSGLFSKNINDFADRVRLPH